MRCVLEAVENCALYAVGTAGDALCAEVLEVMLYMLEVVNGVRRVQWVLEFIWRLRSVCRR